MITETGGGTAVYEGGCFALGLSLPGCTTPATATPVPALDSYTVNLASAPDCGPTVAASNCFVYVTVSAAYPPNSEHPSQSSPYPDGPPNTTSCTTATCDGDTFLVATSKSSPSNCTVLTNCDFYHQISLNGTTDEVSNRSLVLVFNGVNFAAPQTVYAWAVDDGRAEGTRVVTASHSVIQPVCDPNDLKNCFDGAIVRNVEVTVYDNDTPGILLTQIDPNTTNIDNNSVVLEGWGSATADHPITEQLDKYTVSLASAPIGTVTVDLGLSDIAADPARMCLTSTDPVAHSGLANRFAASNTFTDPSNCPSTGTAYTVTFDASNWFVPVIVTMHARNDFAPEDPHNTTITHTIDPSALLTTDTKYRNAAPGGTAQTVTERLDVLVLDDENPGVFVLQSDGSTLVTACMNNPCTLPGTGDSYQLRLNSQPTSQVKVAIVTDGQVGVNSSLVDPSRLKLEAIGGLQAAQAFKGNIAFTGGVITRANGSDLGSFLDEGFQKGQRIRLSGTGSSADGDYVITDLDITHLTVTPAPAVPGGTPGTSPTGLVANNVQIAQLADKGVYEGEIAYDPNGTGPTLFTGDLSVAGTTLTRVTGSFIDDSFLVGTRIAIVPNGGSNLGTFTINAVSDKTLTLAGAPAAGTYLGASITKVTGTLVRTDGSSWLDSGFLEGQLIQVTLPNGTDLGCTNNTPRTTTRRRTACTRSSGSRGPIRRGRTRSR